MLCSPLPPHCDELRPLRPRFPVGFLGHVRAGHGHLPRPSGQAVAEEVISVAVPWETIIGPRIEALRMAGKSQIVTASTQQDVDALTQQFVSQLQEIKP